MDVLHFKDIKPLMISVVIALNVILNSLVIAVIARYPQLREDRTNLFMFSLTLSDLASGLTAMPMSVVLCSSSFRHIPHSLRFLPAINLICLKWFSFSSLYSLCWVTLCKMVAILKPLHYERLITQTRCCIVIACTWFFGCVFAMTGNHLRVKWNRSACISVVSYKSGFSMAHRTIFVVVMAVPLVIIAYATTRMFCAIVRTHLQITAQVTSIGGHHGPAVGGHHGPAVGGHHGPAVGGHHGPAVGGHHGPAADPSLTVQSIRSGRSVLLICLAVLVLTVPMILYGVAVAMWGINVVSPSYGFLAYWISLCNTFDNSLLYLILFRSIRRKTADMLNELVKSCRLR